jgi:hypothetical protein
VPTTIACSFNGIFLADANSTNQTSKAGSAHHSSAYFSYDVYGSIPSNISEIILPLTSLFFLIIIWISWKKLRKHLYTHWFFGMFFLVTEKEVKKPSQILSSLFHENGLA